VASLTPMTRRLSTTIVLVALAASALGACGSGGGASAKCPAKVDTMTATGGAISVCASDIKYDVVTIKAKPGPLKITLVNDGAIYHTLKINTTDLELKANGGKTDTGTVTLSKGTYDFDCTVSGHAAAGMKGTIEVG
jgi:plastocyanin